MGSQAKKIWEPLHKLHLCHLVHLGQRNNQIKKHTTKHTHTLLVLCVAFCFIALIFGASSHLNNGYASLNTQYDNIEDIKVNLTAVS